MKSAILAVPLLLASCFDNLATKGAAVDAVTSTPIAPVDYDALYVVNGESATVSVIDTSKGAVAATIALKGLAYPRHVALSADKSRLGIAVPGFDMSEGEFGHAHHASHIGHVLLLDAANGALVVDRSMSAANVSVGFTPDGNVWTAQSTVPGTAVRLDSTTLAVRDSLSVGTTPVEMTLSADGALAFVANSDSASVTVIDTASARVRGTVTVGNGPVSARPGPGGRLYVVNEPDQSLSVVDLTSLAVTSTLQLGFRPGSVAPAPDGSLWVSAPARGLVEIRDASGAVLHTVPTGAGAGAITLTDDGARAFVANELEDSVSVVDAASFTATSKIPVGAKPNGVAWRARSKASP